MPAINRLITQWRKWINRNKTFTSHEMDELENHLLEEIDDLKQYEGLSEEEAFQKVVSVMGGREALDKEFVKAKPQFSISRVNHWAHSQLWTIILCLILGSSFIVTDLIYSKNHYTEETQVIGMNRIEFQKIPVDPLEQVYFYPIYPPLDLTKVINKKTFLATRYIPIDDSSDTGRIPWSEISFKSKTYPKSIASVVIDGTYYYLVLDFENSLWLSKTKEFTTNTSHYSLTSVGQREIIMKVNNKATSDGISISFPSGTASSENSFHWSTQDNFFIRKNSPNLIYLENKGKINLLQLEYFRMMQIFEEQPYQINFKGEKIYVGVQNRREVEPIDCILWSEVKIIRKPIHLWNRRLKYASHK